MTHEPEATHEHLVLLGLMGAGKTTVGMTLARRLDRPFVDNDDELELRTGETAREVAATRGAGVLHDLEVDSLCAALQNAPEPSVVAAAAAAVMHSEAKACLAGHAVVWLDVPVTVLTQRVVASGHEHRPFLEGDVEGMLQRQYDERGPEFARIATVVVDATGPAEAIAEEIVRALAR